jgi:hypothetical protein
MQDPTDEASIPTKYVINAQIVGARTRRKVATRTRPFFLPNVAAENPTLSPPDDEDPPAAKKPRLEAPTGIFNTAGGVVHAHTTDTVTADLPEDTPPDAVTPAASLPRTVAFRAPRRRWTPEEDAKLTEAVQNLGKTWLAVAVLVPGRTDRQCRLRWVQTLDPVNGSKGKRRSWKPEEDAKLTEAVHKLGKDWVAVAAIVPGRTNEQCRLRWVHSLDPANGNTGKPRSWTAEEDAKLTEAVKISAKIASQLLG